MIKATSASRRAFTSFEYCFNYVNGTVRRASSASPTIVNEIMPRTVRPPNAFDTSFKELGVLK